MNVFLDVAAPGGPVAEAYASLPKGALLLRQMVLTRGAEFAQIGPVEEVLRWGQPSFVTPERRAACSLRVGPSGGAGFGLFVHCQTNLIDRFKSSVGQGFVTQGTRAVVFEDEDFEPGPVMQLIGWALTYHLSPRAAEARSARE